MEQREAGRRRRSQPAPPQIVFAALTQPISNPHRPWLHLLDDETPPEVLSSEGPHLVIWSSLWARRPDAVIRFDLPPDASGQGCDLCWTLLLDDPLPEAPLLGHMRKRLNQLINANLRYTFGQ
ncbi:MAG: hypothetical protein JWM64_106 [Frankiales bacterium]|nr:hypothetical protein [Frankiales bacterium]